ncbi:MAG: hypothetical protein V4808_07125 [Pseudomonadota bacterium]
MKRLMIAGLALLALSACGPTGTPVMSAGAIATEAAEAVDKAELTLDQVERRYDQAKTLAWLARPFLSIAINARIDGWIATIDAAIVRARAAMTRAGEIAELARAASAIGELDLAAKIQ